MEMFEALCTSQGTNGKTSVLKYKSTTMDTSKCALVQAQRVESVDYPVFKDNVL